MVAKVKASVPRWLAITIAVLTACTLGLTVLSATWSHVLSVANVQARSTATDEHTDLEAKIDYTSKVVIDELKAQRSRMEVQQMEIIRSIHELTEEVKHR